MFMNLDVEKWKSFIIADLFTVDAGIYYYQDDYSEAIPLIVQLQRKITG